MPNNVLIIIILIASPTGKKINKRSPTTNITIAGTKNDQALHVYVSKFNYYHKHNAMLINPCHIGMHMHAEAVII